MLDRCDLIVVGGGTAGMSAAISGALCGLKVIVFDAFGEEFDKPCGEGFMPRAIESLEKLGVSVDEKHEFLGIKSFGYDGRSSFAKFPQDRRGFGIRRTKLRLAMWKRARELGVTLIQQLVTSVEELSDSVRVDNYSAPWVCIATGSRSALTRSLARNTLKSHSKRFGLRRHANVRPWSEYVEVHWSEFAELYVTPVSDAVTNIAILSWKPLNFPEALALFPAVEKRLNGCTWDNLASGVGPLMRRSEWLQKNRMFLVGDSAGFVDAMTGEGNALALESGIAAIDAIVKNQVALYPERWSRITKRYWLVTTLFLRLTRPGYLRAFTVKLVSRVSFFSRIGIKFMLNS